MERLPPVTPPSVRATRMHVVGLAMRGDSGGTGYSNACARHADGRDGSGCGEDNGGGCGGGGDGDRVDCGRD